MHSSLATLLEKGVQSAGHNDSSDLVFMFLDEKDLQFVYTTMASDNDNAHSSVQLIQQLHFLCVCVCVGGHFISMYHHSLQA
jgi:hypothetical protein